MYFNVPPNAGVEDLDAEDRIVSRRLMVQPGTKVEGMRLMPGTFVDPQAKQSYGEEMEVVVLKVKKTRALFYDFATSGKKGMRCFSNDAKRPHPEVKEQMADSCADCDHAGKDLQYDLLCLDVQATKDDGTPVVFWLRSKGTSLKPTRNYIGAILARNKAPMQFSTKLTASNKTNEKGNFYVLQFSEMQAVGEDLAEDVLAAFNMYAGAATEQVEANTEEVPF